MIKEITTEFVVDRDEYLLFVLHSTAQMNDLVTSKDTEDRVSVTCGDTVIEHRDLSGEVVASATYVRDKGRQMVVIYRIFLRGISL